jgi:hypothetical protein
VDGGGHLWKEGAAAPVPMERADSQLVLTDVHFRYWPGAQNGTLDRILLPVQRHPCPARLTYLHDIPAGGQRRQRTLRGRASDASGDPALSGGGVDSSMGMGYVVLLCTIMFLSWRLVLQFSCVCDVRIGGDGAGFCCALCIRSSWLGQPLETFCAGLCL